MIRRLYNGVGRSQKDYPKQWHFQLFLEEGSGFSRAWEGFEKRLEDIPGRRNVQCQGLLKRKVLGLSELLKISRFGCDAASDGERGMT